MTQPGNKLEDFRLVNYEERSLLLSTIALYKHRMEGKLFLTDLATLEALTLRLSRTECQPGGCPYCNSEAAREEELRYDY